MERELVSSALPQEQTDDEGQGGQGRRCTQAFWDALPYYLTIGMSSDEYWEGDCQLVRAYRKADELKRQRQNEMLWLQGMYVYEAILDAAPTMNAFKPQKPRPYSSEPYPITKQQSEDRVERRDKAAYEQGKAKIMAWMQHVNAQKKAREEVSSNGRVSN